MKEFLMEFIVHEDFWIFLILIILIINTFIILWSINKESKKTDLMYKILSEAENQSRKLIENNRKSIESNTKSIEDNKQLMDENNESKQ
jgi:hypothetical protein